MKSDNRQAGAIEPSGRHRDSILAATAEVTPVMIREGLRILYRAGRLKYEAPGSDELLMRDIIRSAITAKTRTS